MTALNLTALEIAAVKFLVAEGLGCMGGSIAADLKDDNMACAYPKEIAKALNINLQAVGGVMSSLQQKGLTSWDEIADGKDGFWLTDAGIDAAADLETPTTEAPASDTKEIKMFDLTISADNGFLFTGTVAAASKGEAIKEGRAAIKLAGLSRKFGTFRFAAKAA